ncbi:YdcF family protein [Mucilaginibacter sp. SMC90]|uniref:YdcF family protein n=1 Tax=Mucilaginibacter sp. SMC90 TaxID=2929803 RepID=UPI001FB4C578|nr:YdcF family protein [Mucilaginibacter sp. SMC90]UOE47342.1 YdcF family protein [Mucilaginibacter sp. SMC90]
MKKILLLALLGLGGLNASAQTPAPAKNTPTDYVKTTNYGLLTLFEQDAEVNALLKNDPQLALLTQKKLSALNTSLTDCKDASCLTAAVKLTDDDIKLVGDRLAALYKTGNALDKLVKAKLIPSGQYSLYKNVSPGQLLIKAWEQDAGSINYTIGVYAEGKKPNYPQIDSISYNVKARAYYTLMYDASATLAGDIKGTKLFFEPAMQAALLYLQINERQDPANYEPMELNANKAAVARIKTIKWGDYPYSNILVPGAGPDDLTSPLSGEGMLRCRLAVQEYKAGKAPFIIVSGGKVHPYKTKYNEAEEMKVYLVKTLHIPENVVIIEPHARHTTTNMRNSARLLYKYGIPADKPGIVVTDKSQTDFIMNMDARCQKELNYVPYKLAKRNSETEVEYFPVEEAKQIDPDEPLDPR